MITECLYCIERDVGCSPFVCPNCESEWCPIKQKDGLQAVCPECGYDFDNPKEGDEDDY